MEGGIQRTLVDASNVCPHFRSQHFCSWVSVEPICSRDMFLDSHKGLNGEEIASKIRRDDFDGLVELSYSKEAWVWGESMA